MLCRVFRAPVTAILTDEINRESIDLILIDLAIPSIDVVTIVQKIRRGLIGRNPYCLIVALATDPTAEKLSEIAIAGVDDILVRPFTTMALMKHLHRLVHNRKSFVLTESYFGPNLRIAPRCDGTDETFQVGVPNTLHAKFVDGVTSEQAIAMVKNTHGKIREAHGKVQQRRGENQLIAVFRAVQNVLDLNGGHDRDQYVEAIVRLERITAQMHVRYAALPRTTPNELALNLAQLIRAGIDVDSESYDVNVSTLKSAAVHLASAQKAFEANRVLLSA
ncbi:hypothetical protein MCP1_370003 [Candidatus Terasakiella magnetica]|nr:hypothetical protein MCP1_370003 [Candidatus Terasakiella magnetica]